MSLLSQDLKLKDLNNSFVENLSQELGNLLLAVKQTTPALADYVDRLVERYQLETSGVVLSQIDIHSARKVTRQKGNVTGHPLPALIFTSAPADFDVEKFDHLKGLIILLSFTLLRKSEVKNKDTRSAITNATRSVRLIAEDNRRWLFERLPERFTGFEHLESVLKGIKKEVVKDDKKCPQVSSFLTLIRYAVHNKNVVQRSKTETETETETETITVPGNPAYEDNDAFYKIIEQVPKQTPKGLEVEEFRNDQPEASKTVEVKVDVGSANSSFVARRHASTGFTNAMIMREMDAPCLPQSYQSEEVRIFVKQIWRDATSRSKFQFEALTVLLMFLTSSSYEGVVHMLSTEKEPYSKRIRAQNDRIGVRIPIKLPKNKKFSRSKQLSIKADDHFWLPFPDELVSLVCTMCDEYLGPDKKRVYGYLDQLPTTNVRTFTLHSISQLFFQTARHRTQNLLKSALVCGWQAKHYAPIYYYSCSKTSLENFYLEHIRWLLEGSENLLELDGFDQKGTFGSKININEEKCFEVISKMGKDLQRKYSLRDYEPLEYHNEFVVYTYLLLCLSTAHRPVTSPFEYITDFDIEGGAVWICDKAVKSVQSSRMVYLPKTALAQVKSYIIHLQQLSLSLKVKLNNEHQKIDKALIGTRDFLPWYNGSEFVALTPSILESHFKKSLTLPPNWQRHFLATALREIKGVSEDQVNAILGHSLFGDEPFGRWSGFSTADMRKVVSVINTLFSRNEDAPIDPIVIDSRLEDNRPETSLLRDEKNKTTGEEGRRENLRIERERARNDVRSWFLERFGSLSAQPDDAEYSNILKEILEELEKKYSQQLAQQSGKTILARLINELNSSLGWSLDAYVPPLRLSRATQTRTRKWFKTAADIKELEAKLANGLDVKGILQKNVSDEDVLGCVLISAALNGGLNDENALVELAHVLSGSEKPLQKLDVLQGELPPAFVPVSTWIDLSYSDNKICSVYQGDDVKRYMRWFIDPITLAFICQYIQKRGTVKNREYSKGDLNKTIRGALKKLGVLRTNNLTVKTLCQGGVVVLEGKLEIDISNALLEVAANKQPSVCISPIDWLNIFEKPSVEIFDLKMSMAGSIASSKNSSYNEKSRKAFKSEEYDCISAALGIKTATKLKISRKDGVKKLEALDETGWSDAARLMKDWLLSKLSDGKVKFSISSARRYLSEIGGPLLLCERGAEFLKLEEGDLLNFYNAIICQKPTASSKKYRAGILGQFHRFCETHYGLPPLSFEFETTDSRAVMVRPGYISRLVYESCISNLNGQNWTEQEKQSLILFFILAYRLGLRLGELIKLRLCDIDNTEKFWIYIRTNRYGDNKTDAAYRKVPAYALLPEDELKLFRQYLNDRKKNAESGKDLLFCSDGNGTIPMDNLSVSRLLTRLLKSVSRNQNMVFHHLRHTALSNLQVILEKEPELAAFLTGYSETQQEEIFNCICGHADQKLRIYWYLAAFAGHRSPETTFQHYLHFCNLLIRTKLDRSAEQVSRQQAINILGISPRTFTSKFKGKLGDHRLNVSHLWVYAKTRLKSYTKTNKVDLSWIGSKTDIVELHFGLSPTVDNVHNILEKAFETRMSTKNGLFNISREFCTPENVVQTYIDNVVMLDIFRTRKGNSRMLSNSNDDECLVPGFPIKPKGRQLLISLSESVDELRKILRKQDDVPYGLEWCLEYYFRNTKTSTSAILFSDLVKLKRFIQNLVPIITSERWLIETSLEGRKQYYPHKEMETWLGLEVDAAESQARKITYHLFMLHPDFEVRMKEWQSGEKKSKDYLKYCSSELRYILPMAWIMTRGMEDLVAANE